MSLTSWILPVLMVLILLWGTVKRVGVFDCFMEGAKQGLSTFVALLPALTALVVAISMLGASGAIELLQRIAAPVARVLGFPEEVVPLCILSPVSGSGSMSAFEAILTQYGADSFPGRVASVISGATETTFYAVTIYFGSVGVKKTGAVIPCALLGDIISFLAAAASVRLLF